MLEIAAYGFAAGFSPAFFAAPSEAVGALGFQKFGSALTQSSET
jgi:hypothetical protein